MFSDHPVSPFPSPCARFVEFFRTCNSFFRPYGETSKSRTNLVNHPSRPSLPPSLLVSRLKDGESSSFFLFDFPRTCLLPTLFSRTICHSRFSEPDPFPTFPPSKLTHYPGRAIFFPSPEFLSLHTLFLLRALLLPFLKNLRFPLNLFIVFPPLAGFH